MSFSVEDQPQKKPRAGTVLFNVLAVLSIAVFYIAIRIIPSAYIKRCHFIDCAPASWEDIRAIALARTGETLRIDYLIAYPAGWSDFTNEGPTILEIHVGYVSTEPDRFAPIDSAKYPISSIDFDDRAMKIRTHRGGSWANSIPSPDYQAALDRVRISPRDAFRATWALAEGEISFDPKDAMIAASLHFDENEEDARGPIWIVGYDFKLFYDVDAQTGEILAVRR